MLTLIWLLCIVNVINGAKILLLPFDNASHFLESDGVAKPLYERGHKIFVLHDNQTTLPKGTRYESVTYVNSLYNQHQMEMHVQKMVQDSSVGIELSNLRSIAKATCTSMMTDAKMFETLQSLHFDLAIVDNFFLPCFFILPYKLGIPYIGIGTLVTPWISRFPLSPSVVKPSMGLEMFGIHFCEETPNQLGIVRRFCRLLSFAMSEIFVASLESDYLHNYADFSSSQKVRENAALFLYNTHYLLSSPLPKLPNVEYVGGLTTKPAKPLESELAVWVAIAPNVVVVSFGTHFGSLPQATTLKFLEAFSRLDKYRFIWRFKSEESKAFNIPSNVRLMDWLPQNDVLGHNNTLAFITHSGNNGQQEALYHGVPMLCFYIFGDQKNNAKRVVNRGYGLMISIHDFTADDVVSNLTELIENKSYTQRIKKASAIFHSEKHPSERAADAVEHVLKYGSEHLKPSEALELSFWEYYMLDVLAVLYTLAVVIFLALVKIVLCTVGLFIGRNSTSMKIKAE